MKLKRFSIILLAVLLHVSCNPQPIIVVDTSTSPIPIPTSTSTGMPTPKPTLMSTFTPTPVPWTLEGAINKIPEVYTGAVTSEAVKLYTELLLPLPKDAQLWITEMGFGLEDFVIDANEALLLALLVEKNVPTIMFILTSPNIIDGVSQSDVT